MKNTNLFYGRSPAGAYPLDVSELKELFEMSEHLPEKANSFIDQQINKVIGGKRPIQMTTAVIGQSYSHAATKVVFHVIPISAFSGATRLNIPSISALLAQKLKPLSGYPVPRRTLLNRMNLDGWVGYEDGRGQTNSYVQIYRSGIIEVVHAPEEITNTKRTILTDYESKLSSAVPDYIGILQELEIGPPFLLYFTLVNVQGWYLGGKRISEFAFETEIVRPPEIFISEDGFDPDYPLLQLFNVVWQATGEEKSPRDKDGKIVPL